MKRLVCDFISQLTQNSEKDTVPRFIVALLRLSLFSLSLSLFNVPTNP